MGVLDAKSDLEIVLVACAIIECVCWVDEHVLYLPV